jgi:uncharacterized protein DUF3455
MKKHNEENAVKPLNALTQKLVRWPLLPSGAKLIALALSYIAIASMPVSLAGEGNRAPDLPSPLCDRVHVEAGNKVAFHVYALGVQIYRWNGISWVFVAPSARLFADPEYHGEVGIHYAGPTWESNSGGKVIASRLEGCAPEPTAIAWLLLQMVSSEGPGIFDGVTFIQRVNTAGGLPPSGPGPFVGAEEEVPYTAEYYFYRAQY